MHRMTTKLQGTIESIRLVIAQIGPATARQIETHPDVVAACRSSKAKARRLIERLQAQGYIQSDQAQQQPKYWVPA
jgi:DNA-binding IclR family transcriptional regulator